MCCLRQHFIGIASCEWYPILAGPQIGELEGSANLTCFRVRDSAKSCAALADGPAAGQPALHPTLPSQNGHADPASWQSGRLPKFPSLHVALQRRRTEDRRAQPQPLPAAWNAQRPSSTSRCRRWLKTCGCVKRLGKSKTLGDSRCVRRPRAWNSWTRWRRTAEKRGGRCTIRIKMDCKAYQACASP